MGAQNRGGVRQFDVRVSGTDSVRTPFNNRLALFATIHGAWRKTLEVLNQWAASEGTITPGTEISIVDTRDGGKLFTATYLGFEPTLLSEETQQ